MALTGIDDLDMAILTELQRDARHASSGDIADAMDVTASTVRKRIQRLESEGIVTGYHATVNYEKAGYPLHILMFCTAPIPERESLAEQALEVPGVVNVREIATGEENLLISVVAENSDDLTAVAQSLSKLGLAIAEEELVRGDVSVPFSGFTTGSDAIDRSANE
jgi:DNA-binding Lrp family transcriptional regulator